MFGFMLNERQGKWAFWLFFIGFWVTFGPQYLLGLKGMTRRIDTYPAGYGWHTLNIISTLGAFVMGAAFLVLVYNIYYSLRFGERDLTGDPWNGRTLEWSLPSPVPEYNFVRIPVVHELDAYWAMKENGQTLANHLRAEDVKTLELPKNSGMPFLLGLSFFVGGFGMVFEWWPITILGGLGVVACLVYAAFDYDDKKHMPADVIRHTEAGLGRLQA
jgi:cytochrome aa3-600 menaquinol oxidase subunit 1